MFISILSLILLASQAIGLPRTEMLRSRQTSSNVTLVVTDFTAFMADPYIEGTQSNLSFHIVDPRPEFYAEEDCVIPPTYFSLYAITALYEWCGDRSKGFLFTFQDGIVGIQRGWADKLSKSYTGTATLNPYWSEKGPNPNVTVTPTGKLFTRKGEWLFPVTRIRASG